MTEAVDSRSKPSSASPLPPPHLSRHCLAPTRPFHSSHHTQSELWRPALAPACLGLQWLPTALGVRADAGAPPSALGLLWPLQPPWHPYWACSVLHIHYPPAQPWIFTCAVPSALYPLSSHSSSKCQTKCPFFGIMSTALRQGLSPCSRLRALGTTPLRPNRSVLSVSRTPP